MNFIRFNIENRFKLFFIILISEILFVSQFVVLAQDIDLSQPLNQENYKKWDKYIKDNAPSLEAAKVVVNMAQRHYFAGRSAVSYEIYSMYKQYFPNYENDFNREIKALEELMLIQTPADDMVYIYINYIKSHPDTENGFVALQRITDKFLDGQYWDSALYCYDYFYKLFPSHQDRFDKIISILKAPSSKLNVRNLGNNINSATDEWDPTPSADGKILYFSASGKHPNYGKTDIYFSERDTNNQWGKYKNIGKKINNKNDETIDNVSLDGNTLIMSGDFSGTFGEFDIYISERNEADWSTITHLPKPINSNYFDEGANITPDGKAILFTSNRPGGVGEYVKYNSPFHGNAMGNMDLYVCLQTDSGWSKPINLGTTINTPYAERSPFIHPDGKTMYFSSDGHPGLGKLDVFKSVRLNDSSWTEWSEPINLGKEINTSKDDWGYVVNQQGDTAYFSAQNRVDGYGGWDIYTVTLPEFAKAQRTITIRGKVTDINKNKIIANIKWEDLATGKEIGFSRTNPQTGEYIIVLPYGKKYGYFAQANGYYPTSNNIDLSKKIKNDNILNDIVLNKIEEILKSKEKITVNNIFFDYDKYELKNESFPELKRLLDFLKKYPNKIIIQGHTDNVGSKEYNLVLSKKRADAVATYLIKNGIDKKNISTEGYGFSKPVTQKDEEIYKNRRVEILFK